MIDRRGLLTAGAGLGLAGAARTARPTQVTADLVATCDRFAGLDFTAPERAQMVDTIEAQLERLRRLRGVPLENDLGPAEIFDPRLPGWRPRPVTKRRARPDPLPPLPTSAEDIAFAPAWAQAGWIARGKLTSRALTDLYLARIADKGTKLEAFVTVLADSARAEADARDREQARGHRRGPLHGLPYGLKDLFDTAGVATTWGAEPYRGRVPARDAVTVTRLREAGAVLLAKTSCGAIAYGDIWFGGRTRNPWNVVEGSSGSSAGSAAAVAAGLCSFAVGSETMGSIVSPSARCGTAGLRPTFGRVARTGAMALCWSLDKIGVLARSTTDTALALAAINGADEGDPGSIELAWSATPAIEPAAIKLGYRPEWFANGNDVDRAALAAARAAGFSLVEVAMPRTDPALLGAIVAVEAAAAFEELTLDGRDDSLKWQEAAAWPNGWRASRFEPAIGYVQAQRLRRRLMTEFAETMAPVDAILHPNGAGNLTAIGNHCGYPALIQPAGLLPQPTRTGFTTYLDPAKAAPGAPIHRVPFPIVLTGHLFDEPRLIAIGRALERALGFVGRPG